MKRSEILEAPVRTARLSRFGDGSMTDDEGWTLGCETDGLDFPEGALIEQWGKGIGYRVRGLAIAGHVFWYRTEAEEEAQVKQERLDADQRKRDEFEAKRAELDAAYDSLPETSQERIDRFRKGNPDFRWQFESYEMGCCTDALKVARYCSVNRIATEFEGDEPTAAENVIAYGRLPWEEQKKAGVNGGHSGNSFGFVVRLAYLWVADPGMVVQEHGALTPLVGCDDYGCTHSEQNDPEQALASAP